MKFPSNFNRDEKLSAMGPRTTFLSKVTQTKPKGGNISATELTSMITYRDKITHH